MDAGLILNPTFFLAGIKNYTRARESVYGHCVCEIFVYMLTVYRGFGVPAGSRYE